MTKVLLVLDVLVEPISFSQHDFKIISICLNFRFFFKLNSSPLYKHSVKVCNSGWYLMLANNFWVRAREIPAKFFPQTYACNSHQI